MLSFIRATAPPSTRTLPFVRICTRHLASSTAHGPNHDLIQTLTRYMEDEKASTSTAKQFKVRAYAKAIDVIREMDEPVRSGEQLRDVRGIGPRIAKRIDAFLTGVPYEALEEPERASSQRDSTTELDIAEERQRQIIDTLCNIPSIGRRKAIKLYEAGCTSRAELIEPKFFNMLNVTQQLNVRYMGSFDQPVTREEAETIRSFISQNVSQKYDVVLVGEHRRGAPTSTHVQLLMLQPSNDDVYLYPPTPQNSKRRAAHLPTFTRGLTAARMSSQLDTVEHSPLFCDIISPLESRALVAETVNGGLQKWSGILRIPESTEGHEKWEDRAQRHRGILNGEGRFCRAEISFAPTRCAGAALIALTGDLDFNYRMRDQAVQSGLYLNEYGLWKWHGDALSADVDSNSGFESSKFLPSPEGLPSGHWEFLFGDSEEEIFKEISMQYVEPERRNFAYLIEKKISAGRPRRR